MRKNKLSIILILTLILSSVATGCSRNESANLESGERCIYYLNNTGSGLVGVPFNEKAENTDEMIVECMKALMKDPEGEEYREDSSVFTEDVVFKDYVLEGNQLSLYFDEGYYDIDVKREILLRAAVVKSLVQIPDVQCVAFFVADAPLKDAKERFVGVMTEDSFVENVGRQNNSVVSLKITLYYASSDGKNLVPVEKEVYTTANISSEKLVLQHLMENPGIPGMQSPIPSVSTLLSVSTLDGTCLVNLDSGFLEQNYKINEDVVIYSIVDSLCELTNVNKVQISVNGETDIVYRDNYSLENIYERNLDLVINEDNNKDNKKEE